MWLKEREPVNRGNDNSIEATPDCVIERNPNQPSVELIAFRPDDEVADWLRHEVFIPTFGFENVSTNYHTTSLQRRDR